ncbi:MAG: hypothetical protein ACUVXI_11905 [bacterium]
MKSYKRLNSNVPADLYKEIRGILSEKGQTVTDFVIEAMHRLVREHRQGQLLAYYDALADAPCTTEADIWEEVCGSDLLSKED